MSRMPKPWYRKNRKSWVVTIAGRRHNLGPDRAAAFQRFHELMVAPAPTVQKPVESELVAAVIDRYLDWCLKHRAKRTYEWNLQRCQWFVQTIPDGLSVSQLKPYHVQQGVDAHPNWSDGHTRFCIIAIQRPLRVVSEDGAVRNTACTPSGTVSLRGSAISRWRSLWSRPTTKSTWDASCGTCTVAA